MSIIPHVEGWIYLDRAKAARVSMASGEDAKTPNVTTHARIEQVLSRCKEINTAIDLAVREGWNYQPGAVQLADGAYDQAEQMGLVGAADRLAFIMHSLTLGLGFERHPIIRAALMENGSTNLRYIDSVKGISAGQWQQVANESTR